MIRTPVFLLAAALLATAARAAEARLKPVDLRCDAMTEPLGIDSPLPRLSWKLEGKGRGLHQTAWQVLVASSPELLAEGKGNLWDSGRRLSDEQLYLDYEGRPLRSAERAYWKVRVWDESGDRSAWSEPASWTMGLLTPGEWTSQWISCADLLQGERPDLGYRSKYHGDPGTRIWVQLDLGSEQPIDEVRLCALRYGVVERLGFPVGFKVEASDDPDFAGAATVADYTQADYPNPWVNVIDLPARGVRGRYLRLTATKLRVTGGVACLALSQIEVLAGGRNAAAHAAVTASESDEEAPWAAAALTDGLGVPGANPLGNATLLLRRQFEVRPGLKRALIFVCGLGQCELTCNGAKADDDLLGPSWTQYGRACLYQTRDVTALLRPGANALGLELGGGPYNIQQTPGRYNKFVTAYRPPVATAVLRLEYADGAIETVGTDEKWKVALGPTTYANFYGGEDFDARRAPAGWDRAGFDDARWAPAVPTGGPGGVMRGASESDPPIRARGALEPVATRELRPGVTVYDLGQNAALIPRLRVSGPAGAVVRIIPAELLHPDGTVDRGSEGGSLAYWQYTLAGRAAGEEWMPKFFYSGARYLQVERTAPAGGALPRVEKIEGDTICSDSPPAGDFACSSELFNRIRVLVRWAQRNNLAHVFTDCPTRERLGWLEQVHLNGPALRYDFDVARLYAKAFDDMEDAQQGDGLIPEIAPEYTIFPGDFRDSPEWGSALILAAWQHWLWTGDDRPMRSHYAAMQRYVSYLAARSTRDHLLAFGLGDWYDQGPARPGPAQLTPVPLTATAFYQTDLATLSQIAQHLRQFADARHYAVLAEGIRQAYNKAFYDPAAGRYGGGSQTAQALSLELNLAETANRNAVFNALVSDVQERGNAFTAGDIGYRYVLRALADGGRSDLVAAVNARSDIPGYGYQLARGATSLTEAWNADPHASQDHFMLGQINEWFFHDLAGLQPDGPGFKHVLIAPQPVPGISWARASHESPRGPIEVAWKEEGGQFTLDIDLPPNASGEVCWPFPKASGVTEGGVRARRGQGVHYLRRDKEGRLRYEIESGHYHFSGPARPAEGRP
ncbi:MAG TPA: family 78 glycoside hydrolase catalytic domain [Opitutaceae bacterium]|nr:family 78 glycoside hydrolase catalytic domain [Opitutaceae bacterium]